MGYISKDVLTLLYFLLPGFIVASIFYTLTAHPKTTEFERVIQALVFTVIIKVMAVLLRWTFVAVGHRRVLRGWNAGPWTADSELICSVALAIPLGLFFVWLANSDSFHSLARKRRLSTRTSYPSEWYHAFAQGNNWVVLHLIGQRRLYGWAEEWPDQADKGHFIIDQPEWLLDDGQRAPLYRVERFMVPAVEVKLIEFVIDDSNVEVAEDMIRQADQLLIDIQEKNEVETDGIKGTAASAEPS